MRDGFALRGSLYQLLLRGICFLIATIICERGAGECQVELGIFGRALNSVINGAINDKMIPIFIGLIDIGIF